jgi:hypothetical protein
MSLMKGHSGFAPRNKRFPRGLLKAEDGGILREMSDVGVPSMKIVRPPGVPVWSTALKGGLLGLALGLTVALVFIALAYRQAGSVEAVFVQARALCLQHRGEKGFWPKDCDLARPGMQMADAKLAALGAALAKCQVPGRWALVTEGQEGRQAIVFTPEAPGRSFERILQVVDGWMDDGNRHAGDLRFDDTDARLKLSAE